MSPPTPNAALARNVIENHCGTGAKACVFTAEAPRTMERPGIPAGQRNDVVLAAGDDAPVVRAWAILPGSGWARMGN